MKSTRILALIMAIVMILSLLAGLILPASADGTLIFLDKPIEGTLDVDGDCGYEFVAPEDGWYAFSFGEAYTCWNFNVSMPSNSTYSEGGEGIWQGGYLNAGESAFVSLQNYSAEPIHYCLSAKTLPGPQDLQITWNGSAVQTMRQYVGSSLRFWSNTVPDVYSLDAQFSSSAPEVGSVDESGWFQALTPGTTVITATAAGLTASVTVEVQEIPSGTIGQPIAGTLSAGETCSRSFTIPEDGWYAFSFGEHFSGWNISLNGDAYTGSRSYRGNTAAGGWLTGGETCTVSVTNYDEIPQEYTLTSEKLPGPSELRIQSTSNMKDGALTEYLGQDISMNIVFAPNGYTEPVTYTSSAPEVAQVKSGWGSPYIECNSIGSTVITATSESGLTHSVTVNVVEIPYDGISAKLTVPLIENISGREGWDGESFYYELPENLLEITLHRKDGGTETYSYMQLQDTGYYVSLDDGQYNTPWTVGTNYAAIEYLGLEGKVTVEVIANPGTDAQQAQHRTLENAPVWQKAEGYPDFSTFLGYDRTDRLILTAGGIRLNEDSWDMTYSLARSEDGAHWTEMKLTQILQELGVDIGQGTCSITSIKLIDDTFYIGYTTSRKAGILTTQDGMTFAEFPFPYQVYEPEVWYGDEGVYYLEAQSVYKSGDTYIVVSGREHYYISKDLQTWTKCAYPTDWDWCFNAEPYSPNVTGNYVQFDVAAVTENGVYFEAWYNFGPTMEYSEEGIFFTSDFENYTCITQDLPDGCFFATQPMEDSLGNDRVAIVVGLGEYRYNEYFHQLSLYIYNEQTGELEKALSTNNRVNGYVYNLGGFDPVQLFILENGESIAYFVNSSTGEVSDKHIMGLDLGDWQASVKGFGYLNDKAYYLDMVCYGDTLAISEDYFKTAYVAPLPEEVQQISVSKMTFWFDADKVLLLGSGAYYCQLQPILEQMEGTDILVDEAAGISIRPTSPDAIPERAQVAVQTVSKEQDKVVYEISLTVGGSEVQPNYPVYVRIPVPFTGEGYEFTVYRVEADGSRTNMDASLEDGYLTFLTDHFSRYEIDIVSPEPENPFTDVPEGKYFTEPVLWAVGKGITSGTGNGTTFEPGKTCNRQQIVMFLWRAAGSPEPETLDSPFTDVTVNSSFIKPILWAVEKGITQGTGDGKTFSPKAECTRQQIVMFLWRFYGQPETQATKSPFSDVTSSSGFFKAIMWAVEQGITKGTGDGSQFSPKDPCTRGQIVTFLHRAMAEE